MELKDRLLVPATIFFNLTSSNKSENVKKTEMVVLLVEFINLGMYFTGMTRECK